MSLVKFDSVSLGYTDSVVESLSFSVHAGDYLSIVGENGSGKSTLIKTLLGLVPLRGGEIAFGEGLSHSEIGHLPNLLLSTVLCLLVAGRGTLRKVEWV